MSSPSRSILTTTSLAQSLHPFEMQSARALNLETNSVASLAAFTARVLGIILSTSLDAKNGTRREKLKISGCIALGNDYFLIIEKANFGSESMLQKEGGFAYPTDLFSHINNNFLY